MTVGGMGFIPERLLMMMMMMVSCHMMGCSMVGCNIAVGEAVQVWYIRMGLSEQTLTLTLALQAIMQTKPMRYCHAYVVAKKLGSPDVKKFKDQLYQMWFSSYRR